MRLKTLSRLKRDVRKSSIHKMAKKIGIGYANLYRIINEEGDGSVKTWDKIERFYS